jgi:hypothetical protein
MSAATVLQLRKQRKEIVGRMESLLNTGTPAAMTEWKALSQRVDSMGDNALPDL